jgi:hypothetical protein
LFVKRLKKSGETDALLRDAPSIKLSANLNSDAWFAAHQDRGSGTATHGKSYDCG